MYNNLPSRSRNFLVTLYTSWTTTFSSLRHNRYKAMLPSFTVELDTITKIIWNICQFQPIISLIVTYFHAKFLVTEMEMKRLPMIYIIFCHQFILCQSVTQIISRWYFPVLIVHTKILAALIHVVQC